MDGITSQAIRRLYHAANARVCDIIYEETRFVMGVMINDLVRDAIAVAEHDRRKTVLVRDVLLAVDAPSTFTKRSQHAWLPNPTDNSLLRLCHGELRKPYIVSHLALGRPVANLPLTPFERAELDNALARVAQSGRALDAKWFCLHNKDLAAISGAGPKTAKTHTMAQLDLGGKTRFLNSVVRFGTPGGPVIGKLRVDLTLDQPLAKELCASVSKGEMWAPFLSKAGFDASWDVNGTLQPNHFCFLARLSLADAARSTHSGGFKRIHPLALPPSALKNIAATVRGSESCVEFVMVPAGGGKNNPNPIANWSRAESFVNALKEYVCPDLSISADAKKMFDSLLFEDLETRLIMRAWTLCRGCGRRYVNSRDIQTAVRLVLNGELAKMAVAEGTKAVTKFCDSCADADNDGAIWFGQRAESSPSLSVSAGLKFFSARQCLWHIWLAGGEQSLWPRNPCAGVYLAAVLEMVCSEMLMISGNITMDAETKSITPSHLYRGLKNDEEFAKLFSHVCGANMGVEPNINFKLT